MNYSITNYTFKFIGILAAMLFSGFASAEEAIWTTSGLKMPESVEYDASRDQFYVSNINGGVMAQDNNGSIGLIDGHGKLIQTEWVTGLHSPKGLALYRNKLYVADVKQLVVINVDEGKIIARYAANDSMVLNGIAVSDKGSVFVSDWTGNRIYTLQDGELKVWLESVDLNSPNGLWVDHHYLYIASWGANPKADFTTETSGGLKRVSLATKQIEALPQTGAWINMDGISRYSENKWLISDFLKGEILLLNNKGSIEKRIISKKGSADFFYIHKKNLLIVPLMMDNQVVAYRLK